MNKAIQALEEREILLRSWLPTYHNQVARLLTEGRSAEEVQEAEKQVTQAKKALAEVRKGIQILEQAFNKAKKK